MNFPTWLKRWSKGLCKNDVPWNISGAKWGLLFPNVLSCFISYFILSAKWMALCVHLFSSISTPCPPIAPLLRLLPSKHFAPPLNSVYISYLTTDSTSSVFIFTGRFFKLFIINISFSRCIHLFSFHCSYSFIYLLSS